MTPRWTLELTSIYRNIYTSSSPLMIRVSPMLCAEPLKKKRKIDPAVLKMREERKKRKMEKQIRKLEAVGQKLKPIDELEVPPKLLKEKSMRARKQPELPEEQVDNRVAILKEWTRYKHYQNLQELQMIDRFTSAQAKALDELKLISEELYQEALQADPLLLPYKAIGPSHTPPIENYDSVDGDYVDITRKWI